MSEYSKAPMDITTPRFSLKIFLLAYFSPQLQSTTTGSYKVEKLLLIVFKNAPRETAVCLRQALLGQIKIALMGSSREPPDRSSNEFSENGALKELQPHSARSSGCQATGFHHDCRLLVFKVTMELRRGEDGNRAN